MQSVSVAVAKDKLPSLLHLVEQGEDIEITRHGKPVAVITQWITSPNPKQPSNFDIAYDHFRKQMEEVGFLSDDEIDSIFNQPREIQIGLRHEEDFE